MFFREMNQNQAAQQAEQSQANQYAKLKDVNSWLCFKEVKEFMLSTDELDCWKPGELKQYKSLMPALQHDLIGMKKQVDSLNQRVLSSDQSLVNMRNGLEKIYLYVQRAADYYSDDAFLRWVKDFVASFYWPNAETSAAALNTKDRYVRCFNKTSEWFEHNILSNQNVVDNSNIRLNM